MNAASDRPSSEPGGRAVLEEAVSIARDELETTGDLPPIVVTKDWGDCELERFSGGLGEARSRMDELLASGSGPGHCAIAHLAAAGEQPTAIVVEVGRMGGSEAEPFIQRFRPRRGLFRPFKLVGKLSRVSNGEPPGSGGTRVPAEGQHRSDGTLQA